MLVVERRGRTLKRLMVSCGPGFDTVNQEPGAPPDVVESDCEVVAL
jgi:hypothetical protein